jgi:hypothetical protein
MSSGWNPEGEEEDPEDLEEEFKTLDDHVSENTARK